MGANRLVQPRVLGTHWLALGLNPRLGTEHHEFDPNQKTFANKKLLYPSLRLLMETVGFAQAREKCGSMMLIKTLA